MNCVLPVSYVGATLPFVSHNLVERIKFGAFVEMGELLPGNLSLTDDEQKHKSKYYRVSNITEWF